MRRELGNRVERFGYRLDDLDDVRGFPALPTGPSTTGPCS